MRTFHSVNNFIITILIVILGVTGSVCAQNLPQIAQAGQVLQWDRILDAYDRCIDYPSYDNAKALLAALPVDRLNEQRGDPDMVLLHMFSGDGYPILYEEAISGDRIAIEIHFRLLNITDGLYSEIVETTLGWLARDQPLVFLEILMTYKDTRHMKWHGYPVSFIGSGHNTHPRAALFILEKRIAALESVMDQKYAEIKEACIKQLRSAIDERVRLIERKIPQ